MLSHQREETVKITIKESTENKIIGKLGKLIGYLQQKEVKHFQLLYVL